VCKFNGPTSLCASASEVAFVDNGGRDIASCQAIGAHDGSQAAPLCDIQPAIALGRPYVRVAGHSAAPYSAISVDGVRAAAGLAIIGPGLFTAEHAVIFASSNTAGVTFDVTSGDARLDLTGIFVGPESGGTTREGVLCANHGGGHVALGLYGVSVRNSGGVGVGAVACDLTVDGAELHSNHDGALSLDPTGSKYSVLNSLIYSNDGAQSTITLGSIAGGEFGFNTVVANTSTGGVGGLACTASPGAKHAVYASIVWNNTVRNGSQLSGPCDTAYVDLNEAVPGMGNTTADPMFASGYGLAAGSPCIDAVPLTGSRLPDLPTHDFLYDLRPRGNGYDIGALEAH
jgi:hypothetical protein